MTDSSAAPPPDSPAHGTQLPGPCAHGATPRCCCPSVRCWGRGTPQPRRPPGSYCHPPGARSACTELPRAVCRIWGGSAAGQRCQRAKRCQPRHVAACGARAPGEGCPSAASCGLAAPASASQTAPLRSPPPGAGCPVAPLWHPWAGTCMRFVTCLPPLHPCAVPTTRCSSTFVLRPLLTVQSQDQTQTDSC